MPAIDVLWYEIEARSDAFTKGLADAETASARFTQFIADNPVAVMATLTAAFVVAGLKAAEFASEVEASMVRIGNVMPTARGHLDALRQSLVDLSEEVPLSLGELTKGMERLAALGAGTPAEALDKLRVASQFAVATGQDLDTTITALQRTMLAFNIPVGESARVMDLFMAATQHGVPIAELQPILARVAVVANQAHIPMSQLVAAVIALVKAGTPLRQVAGEFNIAIGALNKGVDAGAQSMGHFASQIDLSNGKLKLHGAGAAQLDQIEKDLARDTNLTADAARRAGDTDAARAQIVRNELSAAWLDFGTHVLPIVTAGLKVVSDLFEDISGQAGRLEAQGISQSFINFGRIFAGGADATTLLGNKDDVKHVIDMYNHFRAALASGALDLNNLSKTQLTDLQVALNLTAQSFEQTGGAALAQIPQLKEYQDRVAELVKTAKEGAGPTHVADQGGGGGGILDPAVAQARLDFIDSLSSKLAQLTGGAAAAARVELDKLWEKATQIWGKDIPDSVRTVFERLDTAVEGDASLQTLSNRWHDVSTAAEQSITLWKEGVTGPLFDSLTALDTIISDTETQLTLAAGNEQLTAALKVKLDEEVKVRTKILELVGKAGSDESDQEAVLDKKLAKLKEVGREIESAVRSTVQIAEAFGLLDANSAKALDSIGQIAANIHTIAGELAAGASMDFTSVIGVVGGIAALVSSLFGESPADAKAKQVMEQNTDAILQLTRTMGEFGLKITGQQFGAARSIAGAGLAGERLTDAERIQLMREGLSRTIPLEEEQRRVADFRAALAASGETLSQFTTTAKELGITFAGTVPTAAELKQVLDAINATQLTQFANTFTGQLQALDAQFKLFDITDPIKQLEALRNVLTDPKFGAPALTQALAGLDLSTPEGRAKADAAIQALFTALQQGTLTADQLGGLTADQLLQELEQIHSLLGTANAAGGVSQSFGVQQSITNVTGDLIAALLTTTTVWLQMIEEHTRIAAAALVALTVPAPALAGPPMTAAAASIGGVSLGSVVINVSMTAATPAEASRVGQDISDQLIRYIDQQLGAYMRRRALQSGSIIKP